MKKIMICEVCEKESFAEGNCPNEIMQSCGYIQDNEDYSIWFCSEECKKKYRE